MRYPYIEDRIAYRGQPIEDSESIMNLPWIYHESIIESFSLSIRSDKSNATSDFWNQQLHQLIDRKAVRALCCRVAASRTLPVSVIFRSTTCRTGLVLGLLVTFDLAFLLSGVDTLQDLRDVNVRCRCSTLQMREETRIA